jgi:hypothetical protein
MRFSNPASARAQYAPRLNPNMKMSSPGIADHHSNESDVTTSCCILPAKIALLTRHRAANRYQLRELKSGKLGTRVRQRGSSSHKRIVDGALRVTYPDSYPAKTSASTRSGRRRR